MNEPDDHRDAMDFTPEMMLQDALKDIQENNFKSDSAHAGLPSKAFLILLWDEDYAYGTRFYNAGMRTSEIVSLLEVEKSRIIKSINGDDKEDSE